MKEEKIMILSMLEEGKISSEEAIKLLDALESDKSFIQDEFIEDEDQKIINKEKAREKIGDFEKVIKEQGEKAEGFGLELGNKLSDLFSGIKRNNSSVNIFSNYENINTSLERNISHIENPIIDFQSTNGSIELNTWDKEHIFIKIHCRYKNGLLDKNNSFYDFYEKDNILVFKPKFNNNITINLEVYLPNKYYNKVQLKTSNGKIKVTDLNVDKLITHTTNASVSFIDISSKKIDAFTKNGRINMRNVSSPLIEAMSTNSHISIENVSSKNLKVSTINGKIFIIDASADDFIGKSSNGSIEIQNISSSKINLRTTNGKIICKNINPEKINELELKTSNAHIDAALALMDKPSYFDLQTSLGNINLELPNLVYKVNNQVKLGTRKIIAHSVDFNEEKESFKLTASTSNGSIRIYEEGLNE